MRPAGALAAILLLASMANAQSVETGISADTLRVGDPFRAVVRIALLPGSDVVLPDTLSPTEDVENSGRVRLRRDSTAHGIIVSAAYPLTAWRTGRLALPNVDATLRDVRGERRLSIKLPSIRVLSVLPADTTNIEAKPPKDVLGGSRLWWPWILLALALALALALLVWWLRRRKKKGTAEMALPVVMPRDRALQELDRIRELQLIEKQEYKRHYTLLSEVLRQYMATVETDWSTDLTTDELRQATRNDPELRTPIAVLRQADLVKFAKSTPTPETAVADFQRAREWIASYPPSAVAPTEEAA